MASLDTLPPDQRAVLQMVLQRGRSYDEIADLLSIDRAAVRARALEAFDALGPATNVEPGRRALITDYLMGQLPSRVAEGVRVRLGEEPAERAWARVIAGELAPVAGGRLAEIPAGASRTVRREVRREPPAAPPARGAEPEPFLAAETGQSLGTAETASAPSGERGPARSAGEPGSGSGPASSRRGGALLIAGGIVALVAVIVVIIVASSSSSSSGSSSTASSAAAAPSPPATGTGATGASGATGPSGASARVVKQVNLTSPTGSTKIVGAAQVVQSGNQEGIVIVAQGVPANTKSDAYAVWLASPTKSRLLGFVNPGVAANGRLSTAGALPTDAASYTQVYVTLETQQSPKQPGRIILQGALR